MLLKDHSDAASRLTRKTLAQIDEQLGALSRESGTISASQKDDLEKIAAFTKEIFGRMDSRLLDLAASLGDMTSTLALCIFPEA